MIPLILLIQSNQVTSKEKYIMERQVTKDASGSKKKRARREQSPGAAKKTGYDMRETRKNLF